MFGDDRDTIYKTSYADEQGTDKLTNYMQHDNQEVRDRTGRAMSNAELEKFNDKAAGKRNRHIVISPRDHADLSDRELDRATRDYMSDMVEDRPTADYVYSVHDDKENGKDVHVAMTAKDKRDLELYPDDIKRERQRAHERYLEQGRGNTRTLDKARESTREQATETARGVTNFSRGDPHADRERQNFADQREQAHDHRQDTPDYQEERESMNLEDLRERERRDREQRRKEQEQENDRDRDNERGGIGR